MPIVWLVWCFALKLLLGSFGEHYWWINVHKCVVWNCLFALELLKCIKLNHLSLSQAATFNHNHISALTFRNSFKKNRVENFFHWNSIKYQWPSTVHTKSPFSNQTFLPFYSFFFTFSPTSNMKTSTQKMCTNESYIIDVSVLLPKQISYLPSLCFRSHLKQILLERGACTYIHTDSNGLHFFRFQFFLVSMCVSV